MNSLILKEKIVQAINSVGLMYTREELENETLGDLIPDSITYISFIVELEQIFGIEIPDEYLQPEKISSLDAVVDIIESLKG